MLVEGGGEGRWGCGGVQAGEKQTTDERKRLVAVRAGAHWPIS